MRKGRLAHFVKTSSPPTRSGATPFFLGSYRGSQPDRTGRKGKKKKIHKHSNDKGKVGEKETRVKV